LTIGKSYYASSWIIINQKSFTQLKKTSGASRSPVTDSFSLFIKPM
jgi:hypothetical protein